MSSRYWTDEEIEEGMEYWRTHFDEDMAQRFRRLALNDRKIYKYKIEEILPNLKKCIDCEYSKVVYDEELNPKKIECQYGATIVDMIRDYCILLKG